MSRIPLIEPEDASPTIKAIYNEIGELGIPVFNVMKMFANNANFLAGLLHMVRGLYGRDSKLDPRLRELAG